MFMFATWTSLIRSKPILMVADENANYMNEFVCSDQLDSWRFFFVEDPRPSWLS